MGYYNAIHVCARETAKAKTGHKQVNINQKEAYILLQKHIESHSQTFPNLDIIVGPQTSEVTCIYLSYSKQYGLELVTLNTTALPRCLVEIV